MVQIGATVGQIKASKDRLWLGKTLGEMLWYLAATLIFALALIILANIPADNPIGNFIEKNGAVLAILLSVVTIILIYFVIYFITRYLRAEYKEATRIVES